MDFTSILGLVTGLAVVVSALWLGHVPVSVIFHPESMILVFGGTIAATITSFKPQTLLQALKAVSSSDRNMPKSATQALDYAMEVVTFVREEGILALQPFLDKIEVAYFRKGLTMVLDNRSEQFIVSSLSNEGEMLYRQRLDAAHVYETAGGFAPTMGILGAVIGLISIAQFTADLNQLGPALASAFSATMFGVALSNLVLIPVAGRLRQQAKDDYYIRMLFQETVLGIRSGDHPALIKEQLQSFASNGFPAVYKNYGTDPGARTKGYSGKQRTYAEQTDDLLDEIPERLY
jgi:chemotaxis protein MotA